LTYDTDIRHRIGELNLTESMDLKSKLAVRFLIAIVIGGTLLFLPTGAFSQSEVGPTVDTNRCEAIAAGDAQALPLARLCEFALTYRHNLPDFVCRQTTTSSGPHSTSVQNVEVTFEKGQEHYSNVSPSNNGRRTNSSLTVDPSNFQSAGEFGSDLVNLFKMPTEATFRPPKEALLRTIPSLVYEFHVAADKNAFWVLRDSKGMTLHPEYEGKIWLERDSGQLLRLELRPVHLPEGFGLTAVHVTIDYRQTPISDLGVFLLPYTATNTVCQWSLAQGPERLGAPDLVCTKNIVAFHDWRKYATKARILTAPPQE
jgi:hypothetical protein